MAEGEPTPRAPLLLDDVWYVGLLQGSSLHHQSQPQHRVQTLGFRCRDSQGESVTVYSTNRQNMQSGFPEDIYFV